MDVGRICAELVRIKSENPPDRTAEIIEYIRDLFEKMGIGSTVTGNPHGECNIVTTGTGTGLLLCGHVDVVPAEGDGWEFPPCSGEERDGFVWGRGATDMKGGCASIIHACESMVDNDILLPATIAFVCDEESGGENGIRKILSDKLILPCDCVVAEPTPARNPCIGQKGLCRLELLFSGTPAHGSLYPAVGESAIMNAVSLLGQMKFLHEHTYPVDRQMKDIIEQSSRGLAREFGIPGVSDILQKITYNPGIINGGEKSNVVAQQCRLELEFRIPFGCSIPDLISYVRRHAPRSTILSQETHEPSMTDPASRIVATTCREVRAIYGGEIVPIIQWAASDARHLRQAGFNVIEYGPGEIKTLHAVNERVSTDSLKKASCIYQGIMHAYR
jgi:succinyl-diaminopimelate desuccinylase